MNTISSLGESDKTFWRQLSLPGVFKDEQKWPKKEWGQGIAGQENKGSMVRNSCVSVGTFIRCYWTAEGKGWLDGRLETWARSMVHSHSTDGDLGLSVCQALS